MSYFLKPVFNVLRNHPSTAAGTGTFLLAFALVGGNMIFAQSENHPLPIWATRDYTTTQTVSTKDQLAPDVREVKTVAISAKRDEVNADASKANQMVLELQIALGNNGTYSGDPDGLMGPQTRAAIIQFQNENNLKPDGEASASLLESILAVKSSSMNALRDAAIVQKVQQGLLNAGIAQLEVDGVFGSKTKEAIEIFQKKMGLDVTGEPETAVLKKLQEIGKLSQG